MKGKPVFTKEPVEKLRGAVTMRQSFAAQIEIRLYRTLRNGQVSARFQTSEQIERTGKMPAPQIKAILWRI
jgi:hypothetical protein